MKGTREIDIDTIKVSSEKSEQFFEVMEYLTEKNTTQYCALVGLDITEQRKILEQAIDAVKGEGKEQIKYYRCMDEADFGDIIMEIIYRVEPEVKYFFIDDITATDYYQETGGYLAIYAKKYDVKFVVTGSYSLGFYLANKDRHCGKIKMVKMKNKNLADYDPELIVDNIMNSLHRNEWPGQHKTLTERYREKEYVLEDAIKYLIAKAINEDTELTPPAEIHPSHLAELKSYLELITQ